MPSARMEEKLEEHWKSESYGYHSEFNTLEDLASLLDQVILGQVRLLRLSCDLRSHVTTRSEDNNLNEWIHQAVQSVRVCNQEGIRNCHTSNLTSGSPSTLETEVEGDEEMEMAIREHKRAFARLDSSREIVTGSLTDSQRVQGVAPSIPSVTQWVSNVDGDETVIQSKLVTDKEAEVDAVADPVQSEQSFVDEELSQKEEAWLLAESSEQKGLLGTAPDLEVVPWSSLAPLQRTTSEKKVVMSKEIASLVPSPEKKAVGEVVPDEEEMTKTLLVIAPEEEDPRVVSLWWVSLPVPRPIMLLAVTEPNQQQRSSPETEKRETWSLVASPEIQPLKTRAVAQGRRLKKKMVGKSFFSLKPYQGSLDFDGSGPISWWTDAEQVE